MHCGLLGKTLGHSYSPQIHSYLADYTYSLFEKNEDELIDFLQNGDFSGLNVTIPYKKSVLPYCAELSERAQQLGAVNTIVRRDDGTLIGHNTDFYGFHSMVQRSGLDVVGKKALVLGSGGAAATVLAVLGQMGAIPVMISRSGENNYQNLYLHTDASLIVNATPVGMFPNVGTSPINLDQFPALEGVLDLIYNPARTKLLLDAEQKGLVTMNGLWMLVAQAKESADWFLGQSIDDRMIEKIHDRIKNQMENTILIGMPGCGKTTVGRLLATITGKKFVDADILIEEKAGKPIPCIFRDDGEEVFRKLETSVLSEIGAKSGLVIATGGGCVTRQENYSLLHQNGTIIWLQRDIELLPSEGRPLSQTTSLTDMYQVRKPMYERFADYAVKNHATAAEAATSIAELEVSG